MSGRRSFERREITSVASLVKREEADFMFLARVEREERRGEKIGGADNVSVGSALL